MHTGKQKQMNASYEASLFNHHIRRFTGCIYFSCSVLTNASALELGAVCRGVNNIGAKVQ